MAAHPERAAVVLERHAACAAEAAIAVAMRAVPRVTSYRGFVFASGAGDGPSLEESLGHMTTSLDDLIDRAPEGEIETRLAAFWSELLGVSKVGAEDSFFDLGGDSILSMQVVARARAAVRKSRRELTRGGSR